MSEVRNAWGFTLFADDLRQEVGGKISVMGVYQVDMIHQADFPLMIPKFVMLIKYYEIKGAFKDDLHVKIFMPGDKEDAPSISWSIEGSSRDKAASPYEPDSDSDRIFSLTIPVVVSPMTVNEEGFIKVRIQCGDVTTRLGRLMMRKVRPTETVPFSPLPNV